MARHLGSNPTYTVKPGDCLWNIAKSQLGDATRWKEIATANGLKSPYIIHTGDVLTLPGISSGGGSSSSGSVSNMPTNIFVGYQAGSTTELYAYWTWNRPDTKSYQVEWRIDNGSGIWFSDNSSEITVDKDKPDGQEIAKRATYSVPSGTNFVTFFVLPIAETTTKKQGNSEVEVANWTAKRGFSGLINVVENSNMIVPSAPTVKIEKGKLTASLSNLELGDNRKVEFQIIKNNSSIYNTTSLISEITYGYASCEYNVEPGANYTVRCRSLWMTYKSAWSDYSSEVTSTPSVPEAITVCKTVQGESTSDIRVYLEWTPVVNATSYDIEKATDETSFDSSSQTSTITGIENNYYTLSSSEVEKGKINYFRVRAVNSAGSSNWSKIASIPVGTIPSAPTTWSSSTIVSTSDTVDLNWVHNSSDESDMTYCQLNIKVGNETSETTYTIKRTSTIQNGVQNVELSWTGASLSGATLSATGNINTCSIDCSSYSAGATINWRVRTAGVTNVYGDPSIVRSIDIYPTPTLSVALVDAASSTANILDTLTAFPAYIRLDASITQTPIAHYPLGFHVDVISNTYYETIDNVGNKKVVNIGDSVYSKNFDVSTLQYVELSANNIDLENGANYTLNCLVIMNSGLSATNNSISFDVLWDDEQYVPNAEIGIDRDNISAYIKPYCKDADGNLIENITLSVYRKEFDGLFTEIATNVNNDGITFITDPHPSLYYARYRIVAKSTVTGSVSYYDMDPYYIGEKAIVLQWAEEWSNFYDTGMNEPVDRAWTGSLLKLYYNIDVDNKHSTDVSTVDYIGRKYPVSYYGTQLGETATWNAVIEKSDNETIYALRRLSVWMGDVYVREPSGTGYWAKVEVTFKQTHLELTIPVTINITRVEGGI